MGYLLIDLLRNQPAIVLLLSPGTACQLRPERAESSHIRSPGAKPTTYRRQQGPVIIAIGYEPASDQYPGAADEKRGASQIRPDAA